MSGAADDFPQDDSGGDLDLPLEPAMDSDDEMNLSGIAIFFVLLKKIRGLRRVFRLQERRPMDMRLALLLHVPLGLEVQTQILSALLDGGFDCESVSAVESAVKSAPARRYLPAHRHWPDKAYEILVASERQGIRWSCLGHCDYPQPWLNLSVRPVVFSYRGEPCWRSHEFLAVVGSRTPSTETLLWMQRELSEFLRRRSMG